jgi:hypothetical protein
MTNHSTLVRQVILRHRAAGYLRFDLPQGLCAGRAATAIRARLGAVDGLYRVSFYPAYDKLAIRFHEVVCDARSVFQALAGALAVVEAEGLQPSCDACAAREARQAVPTGLKTRVMSLGPVRWAREKVDQMRESFDALKRLSQARFNRVPTVLQDPEKAVHEFLTDVLVLYLIKVHWDRITHQWLRAPWTHRYEWLATFYLIYMMVRSRRQGR